MIKNTKCYKILVIEDNSSDFMIVEEFLTEQFPYISITSAVSFREAANALAAVGVVFDSILLDLTLPDKSGQKLIDEMLGLAGSCPVIILTGHRNIDFSIRSITDGITDYLIKDDLTPTILYKSILYAIERKRSVFQLKESEKRYSDIFHLSLQPMWVYDVVSLKFSQVNKAAIALYGYSEEEFMQMNIMDIVQQDNTPGLIGGSDMNNIKGIKTGNFRHHKKTGEIIEVEIYSTPIFMNGKSYFSVIANDVTEKNALDYKITKAIIKTQEDERYEIGAELHDNVCQLLASSKLSLGLVKELVLPSNMWLEQSEKYIVMALQEIRNLSHRLAPAFFDDTTLEEAVSRLLASFNVRNEYEIILDFNVDLNEISIAPDVKLNLYRILQEQLKNIMKYAKASIIEVVFIVYHSKIKMGITDNGIGFDTETAKGGIGLANMKRRAQLFSGDLSIESSVGNGCSLMINIPL